MPVFPITSGLLAVSCGVQLRVIVMTQANELPALLGISACIPAPGNSPWYLAYHAAQTIVDLAVVNVTLVKIFKLHRQFNSVLVKKIMYDTRRSGAQCVHTQGKRLRRADLYLYPESLLVPPDLRSGSMQCGKTKLDEAV